MEQHKSAGSKTGRTKESGNTGGEKMEDSRIIELYWERSEQAIAETAAKYGSYCYAIAINVLHNKEDAGECVNDTYLGAWDSMPPQRPSVLSAFLGKITRNLSLMRWRDAHVQKRGGGQLPVILEELEECISENLSVEEQIEAKQLSMWVNAFVSELPEEERKVFVCRYWYLDPVDAIALRYGFTKSKVKSMLMRTRGKLRACLEAHGVTV